MKKSFWRRLGKWWVISSLVLIWMIFFGLARWRLDPDFGFHLKWGKDLLERGWVWSDQYSYTMPSWPEVRHDWLTNVWMWCVYDWGGMTMTATIFASLVVATVFAMSWKRKWTAAVIPVLLAVTTWIPRAAARPQIQDWLLTALLVRWLGRREARGKLWWLPIALFVLWVNLHGGFAVGLAILGVWVAGASWEMKKIWWKGGTLWMAAFLACVINPYGIRVWEEVWMTMSDKHLRQTIMEWLPFYYYAELGWWMLAALYGSLVWVFRKNISVWKVVVAAALIIGAMASSRHASLMVVVVGIFAIELMERFEIEVLDGEEKKKRAGKIFVISAGLMGILLLATAVSNFPKKLTDRGWEARAPVKAIAYLRQEPVEGNLFSTYGWGGYLIWQYPEKKLFVDGRMPSWRRSDGKTADSESVWAYKEFLEITNENKIEPSFAKYNITRVLWPKAPEKRDFKKWEAWLVNIAEGVSGMKEPEVELGFGAYLEEQGWNKIYEDDVSVVYKRPE